MKTIGYVSLVLLLLVISAVAAVADDFSADMVITSEGHTMTGKMFASKDKFRMEVATPEKMITITRIDKKTVWNLMPSQMIYMEIPFDPKNSPKTDIKGEIERTQIGSETVNGYRTKKYLVKYKEDSRTEQVYQWMASDINFPVKTAEINNRWIQEYKNVKMGRQPDNLFELPSGYQKMQIPTMPGGMKKR